MSGPSSPAKLGIIAGGGALPGLLVAACAATGRPCHILGLTGFAQAADIPRAVDTWIQLGEVGKGLEALQAAGVVEIVMAGAVRRPKLSDLKTDFKGAAMLARIAGRALGDDSLLTAVVGELEHEGFRVVGADDILADLLTPPGILGAHGPGPDDLLDIRIGVAAARALGRDDVGQAVVVSAGMVSGTEDAAGTDALLARVRGGILVKTKKPQQERRVDLPAIGPTTVKNAAVSGLKGIAVEAGQTLMVDRTEVVRIADAVGLFVVGVNDDGI